MSAKLVIGLDGAGSGDNALDYAKRLANLIGDCEILVVYVVEWSPFSFQTPEENEQRAKRRQEEIKQANERVVEPALAELRAAGFTARGIVRHGDVAEMLDSVSLKEGADQIIVNRASQGGFVQRLFGSSTANLVMNASVPVTVVG